MPRVAVATLRHPESSWRPAELAPERRSPLHPEAMTVTRDGRLGGWLALVTLLLLLATACSKNKQPGGNSGDNSEKPDEHPYLVVAQEQQASWIRNFNPLLAPSSVRWPTPAGIYEPLMIYNTVKAEYVPWLATDYSWSDDNKQLTFTVRDGVKWTDGKPLTVADVAFTFNLLKQHPALDLHAVWKTLSSVSTDGKQVRFKFDQVYVPGLFRIAQQPIVPEHIWKDIQDPVTFTNPEPVGSGPFAVIGKFQNQVYELKKNPDYWQPGKPAIEGLRFPAYPSNEQANLALTNGEIDWSGKFIPNIERVYVQRDPKHHKYWFPNLGGGHNLYLNTTAKPFDDVRVRKAISMAVNRERIVKIAVHGYTRPAYANGLSEAYKRWNDADVMANNDWVRFDLAKAGALLDEVGYKLGPAGVRQTPEGEPLQFELAVVAGWSDWISAVQLMVKDFKKLGIDVKMKTSAFSAWYDALQKGEFQMSMGWAEEGPSPYMYYRFVMGGDAKRPVGEKASMNFQRFQDDEVDATLEAFELTRDPAEQQQLVKKLQRLFVQHAPMVPLYPSPSWGISNTKRFTNFPSADNPYARLSPFSPPEYLLVLTNVKPRTAAD